MLSLSLALHKCAKNTSINLWNAYYFDFFSYAYSFLRSFLRNILDASYFRTGYGENLISRRHKLLKLLQKSYLISYNGLMDISMTICFYIIRISKLSINTNNMQQTMSLFWKNLLGFPCISSFMYFFVSCSDNKPKTCGSAAIRVYQ